MLPRNSIDVVTTTYSNMKSFIDALGTSLNEEDITAAANIEGGKCLLGWLAHQECRLSEGLNQTFCVGRDPCVRFI